MPVKPVLSNETKIELREKLKALCEAFWVEKGYKKTSIKSLCDSAGVSIGTFYNMYPTKEDLFLETILHIQEKQMEAFFKRCHDTPTKEGFIAAIKWLFQKYNEHPLLFEYTADFQALVIKLPVDTIEKIKMDSLSFFAESIEITKLRLKVDEQIAYGVFSALLSTIHARDSLSLICDYTALFDFMIESMVEKIFE